MRALSDDRRVLRAIARLLFPGPALLRIETFPFSSCTDAYALMHAVYLRAPYWFLRDFVSWLTLSSQPAYVSRQFLAAARWQYAQCLPILGDSAPSDIDLVVVQ